VESEEYASEPWSPKSLPISEHLATRYAGGLNMPKMSAGEIGMEVASGAMQYRRVIGNAMGGE
jgi:hypothetical protein